MFKDPETKKLGLFFLKLFLIWLSWKAIFFVLGEESTPLNDRLFPTISAPWEDLNYLMVRFIVEQSANGLNWIGYEAYSQGRLVWIAGAVKSVGIGNYCIGVQLMYYYTMLIIITPMTLKKRLIGVPAGIIITFFLNFVRTSSLCLVLLYAPEYIDFAHDHVFNVIVFGVLLIFYYFLIKE